MILTERLVNRYYELYQLLKHPEYILSDEESDEWQQLCEDLLYEIMVNNSDVLQRLRNR